MGVSDLIVDKILASLGITEQMVSKAKSIISSVEVTEGEDKTVFTINLNKIVITVEK